MAMGLCWEMKEGRKVRVLEMAELGIEFGRKEAVEIEEQSWVWLGGVVVKMEKREDVGCCAGGMEAGGIREMVR